jgi:hypothetical protein
MNHLSEAGNVVRQASERKLETHDLAIIHYYIALLDGDKSGMDRAAAKAKGNPGEDLISHSEALRLARSGQIQRANEMSRRAVDLAQQAGQQERAAVFETGPAVWEAFFGNAPSVRQGATVALELSKGRDAESGAALALAVAGDAPGPRLSPATSKSVSPRIPPSNLRICQRFAHCLL